MGRGAGLRLFEETERATFVDRPNRFLVRCRLGRRSVRAYLPNPGRLAELLLPGRTLWLTRSPPSATRATRLTAVAVEREGRPIVLDTHRTNAVARHLVEGGRVPGLEGARVVRAEHRVGRSRFDFLLKQGGRELLLEVKSCTLVSGEVAMFPDAVTVRGRRHLEELAELGRRGRRAALLFVVHWPDARIFAPDFHTDLAFARAMVGCRDAVELRALSVGWRRDLSLSPHVAECEIPWPAIEAEAQDRGSYLLVLSLARRATVPLGRRGELRLGRGWYVYVGSAMAGLGKRIERHRRRGRKRMHWHVDWLRQRAELVDALAVRASDRLECDLAGAVAALSDEPVPGFGASDCSCETHLFRFRSDPRKSWPFQQLLLAYRMDRFGGMARSSRLLQSSLPRGQRSAR